MDSELYTCKQIAEYLQVPESTIRYWTMKGIIPFVKIGKYARYNKADIMKWIEKKSVKPGTPKQLSLKDFI